jgi:glucose 1-dehydrogenase
LKAITVDPGTIGSVRLEDTPKLPADPASLLVETIAVGVCGTDREIFAGAYGWAPPDRHDGGIKVVLQFDQAG